MDSALRHLRNGLVLVGGLGALTAAAQTADDSGIYENKRGTLIIVQGSNETLVYYQSNFPQGQSAGTCECALAVTETKASRWALGGGDLGDAQMRLTLAPKRLVLEGQNGEPSCCGMGWPGRDEFPRPAKARGLQSCKVLGERVYFQDSSEGRTPRKAYVVKGDTVEAFVSSTEPDLVPARFKGPKTTTAGLLGRTQLACAAPGALPGASSGVKAEQLQPLAGKWVELRKKGKGYVRDKPCAANPGGFTLQADSARLEVDWGQETASAQVTALTPGTGAGAYTLDVTREGGAREQVRWKVLDAGKGIVSLTSTGLFSQHTTYVREAQKGAFPEVAEKNCSSEYE